jgi:hypothetical protein
VRLSRNRLESLPDKIGKMDALRVLDVNVNRLRRVPESLGNLHRLERLCLQKNRLRALPSDMSRMTSLQILNVNSNALREIPAEISGLPALRELRFGQNRIQHVASNFGDGACRRTLEVFWLMGNAIVDIPRTTHQLDALTEFRFEDTPVRSPPAHIALRGGAAAVKVYSKARQTRIDCLRVALRAAGVIMEARRLSPFPRGIMRTTGYLSAEDVRMVEEKVDFCVNGDFQNRGLEAIEMGPRLPAAGREASSLTSVLEAHAAGELDEEDRQNLRMGAVLATYVKDLFDLRRHEHDEAVLNSILGRIDLAAAATAARKPGGLSDEWHATNTRKWEEGGEAGETHVVVLSELGMIGPGMVGPNPVPYSIAEVMTSVGRFVNCYGFPSAETLSFKFQKAPKNPTKRAREKVRGKKTKRQAVVVQRIIVSLEEHARKLQEDKVISGSIDDVKRRCQAWLDTRYGTMRAKMRAKIALSEAKGDFKNAERIFRAAKATLSQTEHKLGQLNDRVQLFRAGELLALHQIESEAHAGRLLEAADNKIADAKDVVHETEATRNKCKTRRKQKWRQWLQNVKADLLEKYAEEARMTNVARFRLYAFGAKRRRPWDDGFRRWSRSHAKNIKVAAKEAKAAKFAAAAAAIAAERAGPVVEERAAYVYDASLRGQCKGYLRDIRDSLCGLCGSCASRIAEAVVTSSDTNDPFRWPDRPEKEGEVEEEADMKKKKKKKKKKTSE